MTDTPYEHEAEEARAERDRLAHRYTHEQRLYGEHAPTRAEAEEDLRG